MTRRIEVQNDILYTKLPNVKLPKLEKTKETTKMYALPTEEEITQCLNRAKCCAVEDASKFGMEVALNEIDKCDAKNLMNMEEGGETEESEDEIECDDDVDSVLEKGEDFASENADSDIGFEQVPQEPADDEFGENVDTLRHGFMEIIDPKNRNKKMMIRKSTFVWHLSEGTKKISSDRSVRVQNTKDQKIAANFHDSTAIPGNKAIVLKHIKIGDWCIFKIDTSELGDSGNLICIGSILAFKFGKGKTAIEKKYKGDSVDLAEYQKGISKSRDLEVLSSWYIINETKHLMPFKNENHFFINIDNYVATVAKPLIDMDTKTLFFPENDFIEVEKDILKILNGY